MKIVVNNPAPGGSEPAFVSGTLLRSEDGVTWERLAIGMAEDATYYDYTARAGIIYQYRAGVFGNNDTYVESINYASPVLALRGTWIHDPDDVAGTIHQFLYNDHGGSEVWQPDLALSDFAGRTSPFAEFGTAENYELALTLGLEEDIYGDLTALKLLANRRIVCLRDYKGRKMFTVFPGWNLDPQRWGGESKIKFTRVDYTETV